MNRYSRMDTNFILCSNLMAKDSFKNLGFSEDKPVEAPKKEEESGVNGELRW